MQISTDTVDNGVTKYAQLRCTPGWSVGKKRIRDFNPPIRFRPRASYGAVAKHFNLNSTQMRPSHKTEPVERVERLWGF